MSYPKITNLVRQFPTLRNAEGVEPFEATKFEAWVRNHSPGGGAIHAARFVLGVFNSRARWKLGAFNVFDALDCWDAAHREAFLKWARNPYWV
jgi:hypothetical protein